MNGRWIAAVAASVLWAVSARAQAPAPAGSESSSSAAPAAVGEVPVKAPSMAVAPVAGTAGACTGCGECCDQMLWTSGDFLLGWIQGMTIPPLATTSPAGTPRATAGVLGQSTTTVLFGNQRVATGVRPGGDVNVGLWFDEHQTFGIDAGFLILSGTSTTFNASSDGTTILARPITDATTGAPAAILIGFPGFSSGSLTAKASSNVFDGVNVDVFERVSCSKCWRLDALLGYRYFHLGEDLDITGTNLPTAAPFVPGTSIVAGDHFGTRNNFNGGAFGLRAVLPFERVSLDLLAKVDVGWMQEDVTINGSTTTTVPGSAPVTAAGGLLALSTNSGTFHKGHWAVVPELGANLGWRLNSATKLRVGYTFLFLPQVSRPGDQIDLTVNQTLLPNGGPASGPNRPAFNLNTTSFWVQTLNLGVEISF